MHGTGPLNSIWLAGSHWRTGSISQRSPFHQVLRYLYLRVLGVPWFQAYAVGASYKRNSRCLRSSTNQSFLFIFHFRRQARFTIEWYKTFLCLGRRLVDARDTLPISLLEVLFVSRQDRR